MVSEAELEATAAANETEISLLCGLHIGVVGMDCVLLNTRWASALLLLAAAYRSDFSDRLPFLVHALGGLLLWLRLGRDGNGMMILQEMVVLTVLVELHLVCHHKRGGWWAVGGSCDSKRWVYQP